MLRYLDKVKLAFLEFVYMVKGFLSIGVWTGLCPHSLPLEADLHCPSCKTTVVTESVFHWVPNLHDEPHGMAIEPKQLKAASANPCMARSTGI